MGYAKRVDTNQASIVRLIRRMGVSVSVTSSVGQGFPDCIFGIRGINLMVEIKDGDKSPSRRVLTPQEQLFHDEWKGQICVIETMEQAIKLINGVGTGK